MEIRRTTVEDLPRLLALYARARQFMADHGNPNQWGPTHWPPEALLRQDIAQGKSYVCLEAGRVVGTFFFTQGKDVEPTYRRIEAGAWRDDSPDGAVSYTQLDVYKRQSWENSPKGPWTEGRVRGPAQNRLGMVSLPICRGWSSGA